VKYRNSNTVELYSLSCPFVMLFTVIYNNNNSYKSNNTLCGYSFILLHIFWRFSYTLSHILHNNISIDICPHILQWFYKIIMCVLKSHSQVWWYMSIIPTLGRLSQEHWRFEASLGYMIRPCLKSKTKQ
jgi:hypothetical protein